ncbi:MAG: ABC transporter ATP-binding protein [Candidatus Hydrogenedentes bacterium]|nr:ABC transporter ATP-binding protein [Candidatus Hydrogenedentota bacterium]
MSVIQCDNLTKRFGGLTVFHDLSLAADSGEALCLFGRSGCGKTTLLRLVAGLEAPDRGQIRLRDTVVSGNGIFVPPADRRVAMVFQDFALWPHMRVERHLDFVLRSRRMTRCERQCRADALLDLVQLQSHRRAFPHQLSGGEQQRVSIARALATEPDILLLDEPFSNLDATLKTRLWAGILERKQNAGVAILFATHDQQDAENFCGRILTMD